MFTILKVIFYWVFQETSIDVIIYTLKCLLCTQEYLEVFYIFNTGKTISIIHGKIGDYRYKSIHDSVIGLWRNFYSVIPPTTDHFPLTTDQQNKFFKFWGPDFFFYLKSVFLALCKSTVRCLFWHFLCMCQHYEVAE